MAIQHDIFDNSDIWDSDPSKAFDAFINSVEFVEMGRHGVQLKKAGREVKPLAKSSQEVYKHMFGNYLRWMKDRKPPLVLKRVAVAELREFLECGHDDKDKAGKKLNSAIRIRYLRLLERVYAHLGGDNPARNTAFAVYKEAAGGRDKPKVFLDERQQAAFLDNLPAAAPFDEANPKDSSWKVRRDRAMLAMILGAGLKMSEVLILKLDWLREKDSTGTIHISIPKYAGGENGKNHDTLLRPFAVRHVLPWIEERRQRTTIPGNYLFPSFLHKDKPMAKIAVYRNVKAALQEAGIDVERMGGRTLRNTFAATEIEKGTSIELLQQFLGHHERRSTEKYLEARKSQE